MAAHHFAAPDVRRIAETLIAKHHKHLTGIRMEYLFLSEASRRNGKITLGTARKITGYNALLSTPSVIGDPEGTSEGLEYFLITIAADTWELLPDKARIALVDHELAHCAIDRNDDGEVSLSLRNHEIEEFAAILRRHGLWKPDLTDFMHKVGSDMLNLWAELTDDDTTLRLVPNEEDPPPGISADGEVAAAQGDDPPAP